jgi:hypothetical protein
MTETESGNSGNKSEPDFLHEEPPAYGGGSKPSPIHDYLRTLERALKRGDATEHTHRAALQELLQALDEKIIVTNEPKRSACGAPDFVISRKRDQLTLGYLEAKDVGLDLAEIEKGEQLKRYLGSLSNLLLTDYLEFRWFVDGKKRETFRLANLGSGGKLLPVTPGELDRARLLLIGFLGQKPVDIASAEELAKRLANLTHNIRNVITGAFLTGQASQQLRDWRDAFAATLLPELAPHSDAKKEAEAVSEFADMFAQTLAYGLFSARATSGSGKFTRDKAQKLIPRTNPFLRTFFEQITGAALDDEPFAGFVEDLIQTLDHADMARVMEDFGKHGRRRDPVVHFYETFLQAYDPKLRELRGVYYTPEPVVNYIVQSIDRLLKDKFGIKAGLADHQKITVKRKEGEKEISEETHRVLILDPATGTATFLYTVLAFIRAQFQSKKNAGQWGSYVHEHLLPRLFGFELLMAPYAVAHFKIGLALAAMDEEPLFRQQWSYEPQGNERVNIFLTNTLEDLEHTAEQLGPLRMLSDEANKAYEVKKNKPVLVVLGNPPYSGHSANKGKWILNLLDDYHFCDGKPLNEKNTKWIKNDYVKFIRWAQWRIQQTGQGVLSYITSNGYLDAPTLRGMRQNLMQTFDEIYILNLHGNTNKNEKVPGTDKQDKNVFDIQEGVAIAIFVKLPPGGKKKKETVVVRYLDVWGAQQQTKYDWLDDNHVESTEWKTLEPVAPHYFFIPQDNRRLKEYETGWKVTDMMPLNGWGIATRKDYLLIGFEQKEMLRRFEIIRGLSPREAVDKFDIVQGEDWVAKAQENLKENPKLKDDIHPILYRPFDVRWTLYRKELIERGDHRFNIMQHLLQDNLSLITTRITKEPFSVLAYPGLSEHKASVRYDGTFVFPLYLYPNGFMPEADLFAHDNGRRPNFSAAFIKDLCEKLQVEFVPDGLGKPAKREVGPELIFHYAYAVFHSPAYRERYAEFLRADFPRLPLTSNWELFRTLAGYGGELVDLHARGKGDPKGISFPIKGDNVIEEVRYQSPQISQTDADKKSAFQSASSVDASVGRVWINDRQYIEGVPETAWSFPIGGYLPAQRWLKDRMGRTLGFIEQEEYCRIVWALLETKRIMVEIDEAIEKHGGWPLK